MAYDPYGAPAGTAPAVATEERKPYMKIAMWIAIGALIAAAILCVVWVLVGSQNGLIGRAFLTLLLLAGFAGAALFDASLAPRRPQWYVLVSMIGWVLALIAGAIKIWMPMADRWSDSPGARFFEFVGIVLVLRLAVLHIRLFTKTQENYRNAFTRVVVIVTVVLVSALAVMLILPMILSGWEFVDFYWRVVISITILAALGTALVPLVKALNAPRRKIDTVAPMMYAPAMAAPNAPAVSAAPAAVQGWPTYIDGVTPLPVLPDGTPDWNAYYTGHPTYPASYAIYGAPAPETAAPTSGAPAAPAYGAPAVTGHPVPPVAPPVPPVPPYPPA